MITIHSKAYDPNFVKQLGKPKFICASGDSKVFYLVPPNWPMPQAAWWQAMTADKPSCAEFKRRLSLASLTKKRNPNEHHR